MHVLIRGINTYSTHSKQRFLPLNSITVATTDSNLFKVPTVITTNTALQKDSIVPKWEPVPNGWVGKDIFLKSNFFHLPFSSNSMIIEAALFAPSGFKEAYFTGAPILLIIASAS